MKAKIIIAFLFLSSLGLNQIFAQTGIYTIADGKSPNGNAVTGTVSIGTYENTWNIKRQISDGWYNGIGMNFGQTLFFSMGTEGTFGIAVYQADGTTGNLKGSHTTSKAGGKIGNESIAGASLAALEGSFKISGNDIEKGTAYEGTIGITKSGDIYKVTITVNGKIHEGIGMLSGDYFAVAWGSNAPYTLMEYVFDKNSAKGKSAQSGMIAVGSENLLKK
jgi:hypothetical protein